MVNAIRRPGEVRGSGWRIVSSLVCFCWGTSGPLAGTAAFPNGVAAGDVTSTSVVLWARATNLGVVTFTLSTNADFTSVHGQASERVADPMLPVKVLVDNLAAGTRYFYQAADEQGNAATGTFRTPHAPAAFHGLRFGVSGDWRGELAPYPSVANAPARDLDFFVELGDTIYADYPSPAVPIPQATSTAEFRAKHNEVYSARFGLNALSDLRSATAIFAVHDDHEVTDNFAGGAPPSSDARFGTNGLFINETPLYRTGLQVLHEYNPIRPEVYHTPDDPRTDRKPKLYRSRLFGRDAALFLLDARSFRDAALPNVSNPLDAAALTNFTWRTFDLDPVSGQPLPRRTLLGARQLSDLKADLLAAKAQAVLWKFVIVGEPIQNLGTADAADRFEGYAAERTDLLRFIVDHAIRNVVFISADIHGTVVNNVFYQLGPGQPLVPTGAFEVVTGPVAYDKPLGPTAFDLAASIEILPGLTLLKGLLNYVGLPSRSAFEALPILERDRLFKSIMDIQLTTFGLDATGLEGSGLTAALVSGNYIAVHTYGWTEFDIDPGTHALNVTTYGIPAYAPDQVDPSILGRVPEVVSQFEVLPQADQPEYPALSATRLGADIEIAWSGTNGSGGLQRSMSLRQPNWSAVTNQPAMTAGATVVRITADGLSGFFRLGE